MGRGRPSPVERVRARLASQVGATLAALVPDGYQRLGHVLVVRVPAPLWEHRSTVGAAWCRELGVDTVLARTGAVEGEFRRPTVERIAGTLTVTEVVEHGIRWRFDAATIMFAAGNRTERQRAGRLVRPGERVVDLFAGIGYFAVPAARRSPSVRVVAVEKNPVAHRFLIENAERNGVGARVAPVLGDNRDVALEPRSFDRAFLGWLPDAQPWVPRAVELLGDGPAAAHVHLVTDVREPLAETTVRVREAFATAGRPSEPSSTAREVKPYGPGRRHVVVDVALRARP